MGACVSEDNKFTKSTRGRYHPGGKILFKSRTSQKEPPGEVSKTSNISDIHQHKNDSLIQTEAEYIHKT